jgi:hypothetical protein
LEATALLRTVMEEIDVAIFAFDANETLRLVNRAGQELIAQPAEKILGRAARELNLADCLEGESTRVLARTFPGGTGRYAARWTPREASVPLGWAALDCPGGWASGVAGRPMVLGSMTAQVHALPTPGEGHVITSWQLASEGRKHFSASMLHAAGGQLCAVATAIWIAVHPQSVRPVGHQSGDGR